MNFAELEKSFHPLAMRNAQAEGQVVVVVLLFYVHGKHLRSCRAGQLT